MFGWPPIRGQIILTIAHKGESRIIVGASRSIVRQVRLSQSTWVQSRFGESPLGTRASRPQSVCLPRGRRKLTLILNRTQSTWVHPRLFCNCGVPFQPVGRNPPYRNRPIAWHPVNPQVPKILIQTTLTQKYGMHPSTWSLPHTSTRVWYNIYRAGIRLSQTPLHSLAACRQRRPPQTRTRRFSSYSNREGGGVRADKADISC